MHVQPDLWEFGSPIEATYAPWADPSYWNEGLSPRVSFSGQLRTILENAREYYYIGHGRQTAVVFGFFLLLMNGRLALSSAPFIRMLLLPSVAAALMFLLVHVEGRFLAAYMTVSWLALYAGLLLPAGPIDRRWTRAILAGVAVILSLEVLAATLTSRGDEPRQENLTRAMSAAGIPDGSQVAILWPNASREYGWARLARHRIVAEAQVDGCQFWSLPASKQKAFTNDLVASQAGFAVAVDLSGCAPPEPWKAAADGRFAVLNLRDSAAAPSE